MLGQQKAEDALQAARTNEADFFASEESFKTTLAVLEEIFDGQEQSGTIEEYEVRIRKFDSFTFDGKTAKVTLSAQRIVQRAERYHAWAIFQQFAHQYNSRIRAGKRQRWLENFLFQRLYDNQYNAETYTKTVIE